MAITKTNFINYTRCPRYASLDEIKKEKMDDDISYSEYKNKELIKTIILSTNAINGLFIVKNKNV